MTLAFLFISSSRTARAYSKRTAFNVVQYILLGKNVSLDAQSLEGSSATYPPQRRIVARRRLALLRVRQSGPQSLCIAAGSRTVETKLHHYKIRLRLGLGVRRSKARSLCIAAGSRTLKT
jgi:hypothetical protein